MGILEGLLVRVEVPELAELMRLLDDESPGSPSDFPLQDQEGNQGNERM